MVSSRLWTVINVSLGFIVLLLVLQIAGISFPSIGQAVYQLDESEPLCIVEWKGDFTSLELIDRCCFEARKQLSCDYVSREIDGEIIDLVCHSGKTLTENTVMRYWLNEKARRYCQYELEELWR